MKQIAHEIKISTRNGRATATIRQGHTTKTYKFHSFNAARNFVRSNFQRTATYGR